MGLREDLDTLGRHIRRGTAKEYMNGTLTAEQRQAVTDDRNKWPADRSRLLTPGTPEWDRERGE